jgi:hypothetical protein
MLLLPADKPGAAWWPPPVKREPLRGAGEEKRDWAGLNRQVGSVSVGNLTSDIHSNLFLGILCLFRDEIKQTLMT